MNCTRCNADVTGLFPGDLCGDCHATAPAPMPMIAPAKREPQPAPVATPALRLRHAGLWLGFFSDSLRAESTQTGGPLAARRAGHRADAALLHVLALIPGLAEAEEEINPIAK